MKVVGKILTFICGVYMIGAGCYCMFYPQYTYLAVGIIFGISMVLDAIATFALWWDTKDTPVGSIWTLIGSIISMVLGFYVINNTALQLGIDVFMIYYIAVWLIVRGISAIAVAHKIRKFHKTWNTTQLGVHWYLPLILGILMIVFGCISIAKPGVMATTVGLFMGMGIVAAGINMLDLVFTPLD